ncbi:uncharacterized protein METZ01_LOCUS444367, partial [marine metagenome]
TFFRLFFSLGLLLLALPIFLNISSLMLGNSDSKHILPVPESSNEIYDKNFESINNLESLKSLIRSEIDSRNYEGIEIPIFIDDIIRKKYFHQTAYLATDTNWVLKIFDFLFPSKEFLTAMDPKHLVKKNHGICNQQAIIFQEVIKDYEFQFASIGFDIKIPEQGNFGHFVSAVKIEENWFYFDSNMEPDYDRSDPSIFSRVLEADKGLLKKLYPEYNFSLVNKGMIIFRDLNTFPAKKGVMFQKITQFLSDFSWIFLLM